MKGIATGLLTAVFLLTMVAAYGDHPYSVGRDRDSAKSYYGERRTQEGTGFRPSQRPVRYSTHPYQYRRDDDPWEYRPLGDPWLFGYERRTLFPYGPTSFGRDSLGPYGWRDQTYIERVPVPRPRWDYYYDDFGYPPCGPAYGYRQRHGSSLGMIFDFGLGGSGLTIIIRP